MIDSNIYSCFQEELIEYYPNIEAINQALSQAINQSPLNQLFNKEQKICLISSLYAAQIVAKLIKNFAGHSFSFYVVGRKSAEILESAGVKVLCYSEDIESLINKIAINKMDNNLIYLRGTVTSAILPFKTSEYIIYETKYRKNLSKFCTDLFKNGQINIVTVFSAKCAEVFLELISKENLNIIEDVEIYCFSKKIYEIVRSAGLRGRFSLRPDMENFIKMF